jgi:hypothetical protein
VNCVCVPQSIIILEDDSVKIHAYFSPSSHNKPIYEWEVDAGIILGSGEDVIWKATNTRYGPHEISVTRSLNDQVESCSATVYVGLGDVGLTSSKKANGAAFLLPGKKESAGYGLYSYLLLVKAVDDQIREQQLSTIMQIMSMPSIKALESVMGSKKSINITYLPVIKNPPGTVTNKLEKKPELRTAAEWVLENYDYAHAAAKLSAIQEESGDGPMFYSALVPLIPSDKLSQENHLWLNISHLVSPEDIELWVKEFIIQTQQERFWESRSISILGLKLRMILSSMGYELPKVIKALNWLSEEGSSVDK